ncbi:chitinase [Neolewinella xylanilytica]|uniref:chitinase n=1 Tax=Neolewinella xylanilytica TaxID=1514080 RepID=A0A2S6I8P4_9BACT|nr:glycoside hydrolase family 18 protein [Neolewinella xylanilytica]PPK87870.1 chitinase [Neolewinella xylanilytica]
MKFAFAAPALVLLAGWLFTNRPAPPETPPINIMAYYVPAENYMPEDLPLDQLTHIIFSFANVVDGEFRFREPERSGPILERLVARRQEFPNLKVMVACGGWTADGFSDMALTDSTRTRFAESAAAFMERYDLDGLDMDWEYPGIGEAGIKYRKADTRNFTRTMKSLREHLDALDRDQTLTFAAAGWERYYDFIEVEKVMQYADYMNVMTYDQVTYVSPYTGHHTNQGKIEWADIRDTPFGRYHLQRNIKEEQSEGDWHPRSVEYIVDYCIARGVDPRQIVTGAAFYGRSWKGVGPENNGLYQPVGGPHIGWSAYRDIRAQYEEKNGYERFWDSTAQAPFLYSRTDSIFFTYDDTTSVRLKAEYAMEKNLGGIMFWELGNDTKERGSLLDAIYEAVMD